jgi:rubrerythrin
MASLRQLRDDAGDQTLQNLLRGLTLSLELRSRYRVFEFEASQDGHPETAVLFRELHHAEEAQISKLMQTLHAHLGRLQPVAASSGEDAGTEPMEVAK